MNPIVLIVDDNKETIEFLSDNLRLEYTILHSSNGKKALQLLEKESVHLIVSELMMPVMDGFELCRIVKSSHRHCHIPVIFLTANKTLEVKIEGLESGADAYVEKPFSLKYLKAQIANLLANRDKLKNFFASSPLVYIKSMTYSKADEEFLEKLDEFIIGNLENADLDVEQLARAMNMSRPTFYRKIKGVSDLSPNDLIIIARLKKAAELLLEGKFKIYEIAETVGFASQHHFARSFLKQFGLTPSEYQASNKL